MTTRLTTTLAFATALLFVLTLNAHAETTPGWYVGAGAGGNISPDQKTNTATGSATLQYHPGASFEGSGGYAWDNGFRSELEFFHDQTNIKSIKGGISHGGHLSNNDLFGNALYDFDTGTNISPYIGAGIGFALAEANRVGGLNDGSYLNGTNGALAYQGIVGLAAQLDPNWAVTADYRYVATPDQKFHSTSGRGVYTGNATHNILVGLRYSFDGAPTSFPVQTKAPATTPVQASHAKPGSVAQNYTVFFDFNKSTLTPEAKRIVAAAAHDYQGGHYIRVVVIGHTDTVGSVTYNQKLSEKRAAAIKAEFQKLGVDVNQIKTSGVGKTDLLVPTQDGVREAQNRRGEIVFDKK